MIPEVSHPTEECPHPQLWKMYDDTSSEVEVLDFLSTLIITVKPRLVVETGTHVGYAAEQMGRALMENGFGKLITCEIIPEYHKRAHEKNAYLSRFVECRNESSLDMKIDKTIDILFCDSDPAIRLQEVEHFSQWLTPNSIILIHDVNTGCHKDLRDRVLAHPGLSVVLLPTPRGLAICQNRS